MYLKLTSLTPTFVAFAILCVIHSPLPSNIFSDCILTCCKLLLMITRLVAGWQLAGFFIFKFQFFKKLVYNCHKFHYYDIRVGVVGSWHYFAHSNFSLIYSGTLVFEHNPFRKTIRVLKRSKTEARFPIGSCTQRKCKILFDFRGVFENRSVYFRVYSVRKPKCSSTETFKNRGTTVHE